MVDPVLPTTKVESPQIQSSPPPTGTGGASSLVSEPSQDSLDIEQENEELRAELKCKICYRHEVSMVIIPCGHLVSCQSCTTKVSTCPVCRGPKESTVRAFLS